ncbi:ParB/RepB/Spo0J family partition protein [Deinococcus humi]|uniref:ParB family chromosome partitioning protein n=1 Tax=Deinococcus humi TaxID=662880 RepID=A0A7W8NHR4_9DEIO|nr:ParB/RepB/Spo0J family partition protein [Deinococcus humi]MBB5366165.1 ParB family chromosome partitioning protein [Deinococcus humi]GGO40694.1 putative chromosome 2-partitioning protein ParB [Deinococcus humi]
MSRKLSAGMQAALKRTQAVHEDIQSVQRSRPPVQYVALGDLRPSPFQARMDLNDLDSLAQDIAANGVLQPLLARPVTGGGFELIAGERRWRAAERAGLAEVPVMVREATDEQARLYGLRENLERQDLNAYEVASVALTLMGLSLGQSPEEVRSQITGRGEPSAEVSAALEEALGVLGRNLTRLSFAKHYLPLLDLPDELRAAIQRGAPFNAVRLLRRASTEQQAEWLPRVESGEWGVRDVEAALLAGRTAPAPSEPGDLVQETRRVLKLAAPRRVGALDARKQTRLRKLLQEVEQLLKE